LSIPRADHRPLDRAPNAWAQGALDVISKDVVADAEIVAPPFDDHSTTRDQAVLLKKRPLGRPLRAPVTRLATIPAKDLKND